MMKILKNKVTIVFLIFLVFVGVISISFHYSNKTFQEKFKEKNPNIETLAIFVDGEEVFDIPKKGSGYTLSSESNCNNGVTVAWDDTSWSAKVNYTNFQNNNERTKCNLYFEKMTFAKSIIACAKSGGSTPECMKDSSSLESSLVYDATTDNNLRYIGANPNNYVSFNNELWRIIGVMENVDDGTGKKEARLKIIRNESIGSYSWDSSESTVNSGQGVNEWSQSDAMKLLNPNHDTESVGGSLYWNRGKGTCYSGINNATKECDFTTTGLSSEAKKLIGNAVWHTGSNGTEIKYNNILTSKFYELERTNSWLGAIGLMSSSDYGYATSGGINANISTCLTTELYNWDQSEVSDCYSNDWLYGIATHNWTIVSVYTDVIRINHNNSVDYGGILSYSPSYNGSITPTTFLNANVKITDGEGSSENPFILELQE